MFLLWTRTVTFCYHHFCENKSIWVNIETQSILMAFAKCSDFIKQRGDHFAIILFCICIRTITMAVDLDKDSKFIIQFVAVNYSFFDNLMNLHIQMKQIANCKLMSISTRRIRSNWWRQIKHLLLLIHFSVSKIKFKLSIANEYSNFVMIIQFCYRIHRLCLTKSKIQWQMEYSQRQQTE